MQVRTRGRVARALLAGVLTSALLSAGCTKDDEVGKAITSFQTSSTALTTAYQTLLTNANTIEQEHYIDVQAFSGDEIKSSGLQSSAILTEDEIKLRTSAMKALTDYTTALATLASGKDAAKVQTDCDAASKSLKTLSTDAGKALANATANTSTTGFANPVSTAVSAMGDVLELILKHHNLNEVRESIFRNDVKLTALYNMIYRESTDLYLRQRQSVSFTTVTVLADYNRARSVTPTNPADLLQLTDRLKQAEKESAALSGCDPAKPVTDFKKTHDALVKAILAPKTQQRQTVAQLIAEVKSLAADVTPLAQNTQTLASVL